MNAALTIEGKWWVYGSDKEPEFGVLKYAPETGLELTIKTPGRYSTQEVLWPPSPLRSNSAGVLIGEDEHCRPVTLYGCYQPGRSLSAGLVTMTYQPIYALLGQKFKSWGETKVQAVRVKFSLLHNWMGPARLHVRGVEANAPVVDVERSEPTEVPLADGVKLVLLPVLGYHANQDGIALQDGHSVEFQFPHAERLGRVMENYVAKFRRFLTFFAGERVFLETVWLRAEGGNAPGFLTLLGTNPGVTGAERDLSHHNMVVSFPDIRDRFVEVVQQWFQLEEQIRDPLNLYFATIFNPSLYTNHEFLFLAQALEVYHRCCPRFEGGVQPTPEFKQRRQKIIDSVPADEREWVGEKLAFANEKTLAQRLRELLDCHSAVVARFIKDPAAFADKVRHTRNFFTHYTSGEEKMAKGADLMSLSWQMRTLLEVCVFSDLRAGGAALERLINNSAEREYRELDE